jgi:hypothetical protein
MPLDPAGLLVAHVDPAGQELGSSQLFEDAVFWAEVEEEEEQEGEACHQEHSRA